MAGARVEVNGLIAIVLGSLVLVGNCEEDGRAEGAAKFGAGVDGDSVLFVAGSCDG